MRDAPTTRISLLAKLSEDSNEVAWREFVELYEPAIYRFVRRRGLQDADAQEVVQEVLLNVQQLAANPPSKPIGSFRGWLSQVARHRAIDLVRKRIRLEHVLQSQNASPNIQCNEQQELSADVRHQMFVIAAQRIQKLVSDMQWQSFWQTTVELQSPKQVAERLKTSVGNVYVAKCRVMEKLREEIDSILRKERKDEDS